MQVFDGDEIMLISDKGTLVRTRVDEVSVQGRNTQGVRLIKLKEGEALVGVERVEEPGEQTLEQLAMPIRADDATDVIPDNDDDTRAEDELSDADDAGDDE